VKISVVIPALDEAQQVGAAVETASAAAASALRRAPKPSSASSPSPDLASADPEPGRTDGEPAPEAPDRAVSGGDLVVDVWVVDGGSGDATVARAQQAGARVIVSESGRAAQLQRGVEESDGDVVLFLHADTRLPPGWGAAVRRILDDPAVCGGAFRFRFESPRDWRLKLIEGGANWRARWLGMPYGDQAIFVRRQVLQRLGGVPQAPLMEDLDLVRGMKRQGRLGLASESIETSARRYQAAGPLRTAIRHAVAALAWGVGIDRERIAGWYRRTAARPEALR
jgi:rSAM/selenodomain-associated transferase 2